MMKTPANGTKQQQKKATSWLKSISAEWEKFQNEKTILTVNSFPDKARLQ